MNDPVPLPIIAACAIAVILALWWVLGRGSRPQLPYSKRRALLSAAELRFYRVLLAATPPGLTVFVKARLMDVLTVAQGQWQKYGAPGSGQHLDFVLADASTTEAMLVVELDDRSHSRAEVRERDQFKGAALAAAGLPLVRVRAARGYDAAELRARIRQRFKGARWNNLAECRWIDSSNSGLKESCSLFGSTEALVSSALETKNERAMEAAADIFHKISLPLTAALDQ